jgi:hypothetical protein
MSRKKGTAELEHSTQKFIALTDLIARLGHTAMRCATPCIIAYFFYKSVEAMSGKTTVANLVMDWASSIKLNQWAAWVLATVAGAWGVGERRLRRRKTAELSERLKRFETVFDRRRSSSTLNPSGQPQLEDRL